MNWCQNKDGCLRVFRNECYIQREVISKSQWLLRGIMTDRSGQSKHNKLSSVWKKHCIFYIEKP